jgi:hypothetical protein
VASEIQSYAKFLWQTGNRLKQLGNCYCANQNRVRPGGAAEEIEETKMKSNCVWALYLSKPEEGFEAKYLTLFVDHVCLPSLNNASMMYQNTLFPCCNYWCLRETVHMICFAGSTFI